MASSGLTLRDHQDTLMDAEVDPQGQLSLLLHGRDLLELTTAQTETLTNWLMAAKISRETP